MCFAIPYKIIAIKKSHAIIENGRSVVLGKDTKANVGEYIQVVGDVATGVLSQKEGLTIRKLIKSLNN